MSAAPQASARLYAFYRDYLERNGYAPTREEGRAALGASWQAYGGALSWLLEQRFLTRHPRVWRGIRIQRRACACGVEITPENAVLYTAHGRQYVRRPCATCWRAQVRAQSRAWRENNPGYNARWLQVHYRLKRQQQVTP